MFLFNLIISLSGHNEPHGYLFIECTDAIVGHVLCKKKKTIDSGKWKMVLSVYLIVLIFHVKLFLNSLNECSGLWSGQVFFLGVFLFLFRSLRIRDTPVIFCDILWNFTFDGEPPNLLQRKKDDTS